MSHPRSKARKLAVQAIYQWGINASESQDIFKQFRQYETWHNLDEELFYALIKGVQENIAQIDEEISTVIDRDMGQLDPVELSLLRLGTYELLDKVDVPYKVVLNEYINLAKVFGSTKSHMYVNAALDKLSQVLRPLEKG